MMIRDAAGQASPSPASHDGRLPEHTHIGRARLRVADIERSLRFYSDVLGFELVRAGHGTATLRPGAEPDGHPAAARELIVLEETPGLAPRPRRPVSTGLYHIALLVPSRRALGRTLLGLRDARYPLRGVSDHAVSESIYLDDPDGNGFEIYADRPRSQWPRLDGSIQMTTEPMDVD